MSTIRDVSDEDLRAEFWRREKAVADARDAQKKLERELDQARWLERDQQFARDLGITWDQFQRAWAYFEETEGERLW